MNIEHKQLQNILHLIKQPYFTKKTLIESKKNKYTFLTDCSLNKTDIKNLFLTLFNLKIQNINTSICSLKKKKVRNITGVKTIYKKIIFKVENIDCFEKILNSNIF